jgi:hypothetical protein
MGDIYRRATNVIVWLGDGLAAYRASFSILWALSSLYENAKGIVSETLHPGFGGNNGGCNRVIVLRV